MVSKMHIGVIGLGKFGLCFARNLHDLGQVVLGVDLDPDNIKQAQQFLSFVYQADAADKEALKQIGFSDLSHVLVSVGSSISASSMISLYLKEMGVPVVWVKAVNLDHQRLLNKIGVENVIIPEHVAASQLATQMVVPGFLSHLPFDKDLAVKEIAVDRWSGKSLRDLDLTNRFQIQVVAVKKAGQDKFVFIPKADDVLHKGDVLVVISHLDDLLKIKA